MSLSSVAQQFKSISVKEGLTDNGVESVEKDHLGYMWFATQDGLCRFDGYKFRSYSLKGFGFNYNSFSYVAEDQQNNLWVRSAGGDVYLYDRINDRLTANYSSILEKIDKNLEDIDNIFVDTEKNIWILSKDLLYFHNFDKNSTFLYDIDFAPTSVVSHGDISFMSDSRGMIWQLSPEKKQLTSPEGANSHSVKLYLDSIGRLWMYSDKVMYYDSDKWIEAPMDMTSSSDFISDMLDDRSGRLWIATNTNGIITLTYDLKNVEHIVNDYRNDFSLASNHVNSLYISDDRLLWAATGKKGVSYTALDHLRIERINTSVSEDIGTIQQDKNGQFWIGYDGKGLRRLETSNSGVNTITLYDAGADNIVGSYLCDDGSIIMSTYGSGVFRWDGKKRIPIWSSDPAFSAATNRVREIFMDKNGNTWFNTFNRGVVCLLSNGQMKQYTTANSELISNSMVSMTYSESENKIYATCSESISEIDCNTLDLKHIQDFVSIRNLHYDNHGLLWVGTTDGLFYIDMRRGGKPVLLSKAQGMSDNRVMGICSDNFDNLWVTTGNGFTNIYIYNDPVAESVVTRCYPYYEQDGIGQGHFTKNAVFCDKTGNILMGCDGDIIKVYPEKYPPKTISHNLFVTGLAVSEQDVPMESIDNGSPVRMKFYDKLMIEVSAMDYQNRLRIRYDTKLDDAKTWNTLATNVMKFNSLPPGKHTVYVRVNDNNTDDENIKEINVVVRPPFQRSWMAFILYTLLIAAAFLSIYYHFKVKNRERMAIEKLEMDEMRMQFFTNISHDLRTPLTMIITPISRLLRDSRGTPMEADLELVNRSANTLKDEINQLLDFRKLGRANLSMNASYGDICRYVAEVSESFTSVFSDGSIKLVMDIQSSPIMMDFDKDKIQRILRNLLSNSFKFSESGSEVTVSVKRDGENAVIKVADTGRGISDAGKAHIFDRFYQEGASVASPGSGIGLNIVYEYTKIHGGSVSVTDNKPRGSIFTVTIPIVESLKPESQLSEAEVTEEQGTGPRILIVEDNENFRTFLSRSLSDTYSVIEAGDGKAALEVLASNNIDIVISDVMMPVMDGIELCKAIKNDIRFSHIPIIMLTAIQNEDILIRSLKEGADEYISKPFDIEVLNLKIQKILSWSKDSREKWSEESTLRASEIAISRLDKELMEKITQTVEKNLTNTEYSIEELSSELGISRSRLYKKLTSITGKSPIEFIRILRLKKGKQLLEEGETSVSQIAWSVGFSPKQFSKYFKDEYGCLPSEYIHHLADSAKN